MLINTVTDLPNISAVCFHRKISNGFVNRNALLQDSHRLILKRFRGKLRPRLFVVHIPFEPLDNIAQRCF